MSAMESVEVNDVSHVDGIKSRKAVKKFSDALLELIPAAMKTGDFSHIKRLVKSSRTPDPSDKTSWDRIHEDVEMHLRKCVVVDGQTSPEFCRNVVRLAVLSSDETAPLVAPMLPGAVFLDVFDIVTIQAAERLFEVVEEFRSVWKSPQFGENNKNTLLRLGNNLLKRLSKSQNTTFCSRILQFLASVLPPSERSGLNIVGEFNLENVTHFSTQAGGKTGDAKALEGQIYEIFWGLQDFFRNPNQMYNGTSFRKFKDSCEEVFKLFRANKIELVPGVEINLRNLTATEGGRQRAQFFGKYLTNAKLMDLEMRDPMFRRSFLLQFLVIAQFHLLPFKFRHEKNQFSTAQRQWLQKASRQALSLIRETPPDGVKAAALIRKLLSEERTWIAWKNGGCQPVTPVDSQKDPVCSTANLRKFGFAESKFRLRLVDKTPGLPAKQKLFALPSRDQYALHKFGMATPAIEDFCKDVLVNIDKQLVGKSKKLMEDPNFIFRAMRLVKSKSTHYPQFDPGCQSTRITDCLIFVLERTKEDMITRANRATKVKAESSETTDTANAKPSQDSAVLLNGSAMKEEPVDANLEEEMDVNEMEESNLALVDEVGDMDEEDFVAEEHKREAEEQIHEEVMVDNEMVEEIAPKISVAWQEVGKKLHYKEDELEHFLTESKGDALEATKTMLKNWIEVEGEDGTLANLKYWCAAVGVEL